MKKRTASVASMLLAALMVLTGCGGDKEKANTDEEKVSVGLVTDEGGLNDKSFNQSANEGLVRAADEFGIDYTALESQKKDDFYPNIQAIVDEGSDLTFAAGYQLADALSQVALGNPDKHFCIIDSIVDQPNVVSLTFKEEEGSFLVGVIAGLMTKTNKVGFIGGKDTETIEKFECGFAAGVKAVNPAAAEGLISPDGKSPGTNAKYADSYSDTNKGYEYGKSLYESGCDIIYHAAGGVGIGMFQAAQASRENGKEVWGIGVDMDQSLTLPEYSDVILTSMVKNVDIGTYETVKEYVDGTIAYVHKELGLADNGVGIAETSSENVSADALKECDEYSALIKEGKIVVPKTRAEVMEFK